MQSDNEESVLPLILLLIRLFLPTFSGPRRLSIPAPLAAAAGLIAFLSFFSLETIFFLNFHRNWFPFTDFSKKKFGLVSCVSANAHERSLMFPPTVDWVFRGLNRFVTRLRSS